MVRYCEVCGRPHAEIHHIIFRSEASYLSNIPINFKYLCSNCHRGKNGPHMNRHTDIKYKKQLQQNLFQIFESKAYYSEAEIIKKLDISSSEISRMFKGLRRYKEGYKKEDIVALFMGGTLYIDEHEKEILDLIKELNII